jgi:hypothetical protein
MVFYQGRIIYKVRQANFLPSFLIAIWKKEASLPHPVYIYIYIYMYEREREREISLPNRMSLHPGLLWLTLNQALVSQCLSLNIFFSQFYLPRKNFSRTP